jgi:hypothetical protein
MYMNDVMYHLKAPNFSFMTNVVTFILVFIWLTERKIKQGVHLENSTKSVFIYRHQEKIIISRNCVSHHLKASYCINKNQAAGLNLPHMCLTDRCMGLSRQHKSTAQHLQGRWWLCLVSRVWHSTLDRLTEYLCQNFVRQKMTDISMKITEYWRSEHSHYVVSMKNTF